MTALPAEALHVENREPEDFNLGECLLHALQFVWLDDCDDEFHVVRPPGIAEW
jgi:hypothetical protein